MLSSFKKNWTIYLIEAWALGMFMISAAIFVILIEHPQLPVYTIIPSSFVRRVLIGSAMGLTAILLIYSAWGKRSGAHMNPAVTLAQLQLNRIHITDAIWYIIFQFIGGALGIAVIQVLLPQYISAPSVNYVITTPIATTPAMQGICIALGLEILLSFIMLTLVLVLSNIPKIASYTGYFVGITIALFITFEAPFSGMSINPARTVSSAIWANIWTRVWIYFIGPIIGMQAAAWIYRKEYLLFKGECKSMKMHLSGNKHNSPIYKVLWFTTRKNNKNFQ